MAKADLYRLKRVRADLIRSRQHTAEIEAALMELVADYLNQQRGGVREIARTMGFSPSYICDVQHGRRKISDQFLERLERLL